MSGMLDPHFDKNQILNLKLIFRNTSQPSVHKECAKEPQ